MVSAHFFACVVYLIDEYVCVRVGMCCGNHEWLVASASSQ
jgi:hypothetical protein